MRKLFLLLLLSAAPLLAQSGITGGVRSTGTIAANDCVKFVSKNVITSAGGACTTGGGSSFVSKTPSADQTITGAHALIFANTGASVQIPDTSKLILGNAYSSLSAFAQNTIFDPAGGVTFSWIGKDGNTQGAQFGTDAADTSSSTALFTFANVSLTADLATANNVGFSPETAINLQGHHAISGVEPFALVEGQVFVKGPGTIDQISHYVAETPSISGGAVVTGAAGVFLESWNSTSSPGIVNGFGIYGTNQGTGVGDWAFAFGGGKGLQVGPLIIGGSVLANQISAPTQALSTGVDLDVLSTTNGAGVIQAAAGYWLKGSGSGVAKIVASAAAGTPTLTLPTTTGTFALTGTAVTAPTYSTSTNCANGSSPATCAAAASGAVAVPTGTNPTLVVNTTAVTASSRIFLTVDESLTIAATTCNTTLSTLVQPVITARTAGTSFTMQIGAVIAANPACVSFFIVN